MMYPIFYQKDIFWKDVRLGFFSPTTIGSHGCLLCCLAMLCKFWGKDTDPLKLHNRMKGLGLFWRDNVLYKNINKVYPDILFAGAEDCYNRPAPISTIDKNLPLIALVDLRGRTFFQDAHFVVLWEKRGNDYLISDPLYGEICLFSKRYGNPITGIFGLRYFKKGMTDEQLRNLYLAIFHRAPDPEGFAFWRGKSLDEFLDGTLNGDEWENYTPLFEAGKLLERWGRSEK